MQLLGYNSHSAVRRLWSRERRWPMWYRTDSAGRAERANPAPAKDKPLGDTPPDECLLVPGSLRKARRLMLRTSRVGNACFC